MSGRVVTIEPSVRPPLRRRPAALAAVAAARVLERLSPYRIRQVLETARRGARPADEAMASQARNDVVAVSMRCAGPRCLQRSIATALLCRMRGGWPQWCTGVRTQPFQAHAWVAVDGRPVGESSDDLDFFRPMMTVPGGPS
ncbi:lasso peptide biosynthesis B2 protein [Spirillospora sp. NPDC127200]